MSSMQCPFCGQLIPQGSTYCYRCRETLPTGAGARGRDPAAGHHEIRRGLLFAFLAGVIHYFASGTGGFQLPIQVPEFLTQYLTGFLFLGGVGLFLYGLFLKIRG